jgi:micrococcal nuclease
MLRYLLTTLLIAASPTYAESIDCRVIGIADGDTFSCLADNREQVRVRLAEIDAPESGQPYGNRARQALSGFIFGKNVTLIVQDRDRYGRTVARVKVANVDVNSEMVRSGAAWAYREYLKDRTLLNLEAVAKEFKRGLWSLPKAEQKAPWEWRKAKRGVFSQQATSMQPVPSVTSKGGFTCSVIKSCRQMSGCAEARFQLQKCQNPRIDGDRDGVPCEAICRQS